MDSKNRLAIAIAITCLIVVAIFASFGRSLFFVHIPSITLSDASSEEPPASGSSGPEAADQYWQDRAWSHTRQDLASGAVRHDLAGPEKAYYWYEGSSAWNALPADERSHDLAQHIPTYETVLDLDPDSITETGYELRGPYPCVYVAFQGEDSASVERYWISTDNGLLVSAEREINGELVYRMTAYGQVQIPCPATASFALPDGQVLHTV